MPTVARADVLKAVYEAASRQIQAREMPTMLIPAEQTIFRSVPARFLPKPVAGGHVSKRQASEALKPRDGADEAKNRFSGPSYNSGIRDAGGLYYVLQQQALVNEVMHYALKGGVQRSMTPGVKLADAAMEDKCVIKIVLMRQILVAELSPHNPGMASFLKKLEHSPGLIDLLARTQYTSQVGLWSRMVDGDDCSVARGLGLAVANSGFLGGLAVQTVRKSGRSDEERGDNLVLFGASMQPIPGLYVDQAYYFNRQGAIEAFPVEFP